MPTSSRSFWPEVVMLRPDVYHWLSIFTPLSDTFSILQSCQVENELVATAVTFVFQSTETGGVIHVQSCMDGIGLSSQTGSNGGWLDAFAPRSERKLCRGRRNVLFKKNFDATETNLRGSTSSLHLNGFRPSPLWSQLEWSMSQWSANRMPTARKQNGYRLERVCPFRSI